MFRYVLVWVLLTGGTSVLGQSFRIIPREVLDSLAHPVAATDSPVRFEVARIDLGTIDEEDEPKAVRFVWHNAGDEPVVITRVQTGCGCAVATYDRRPVQPAGEGAITVTYHPKGHPGPFERKILVYAQPVGEGIAAVLTLTGRVTPSAKPTHDYPYAMGPLRLKQQQVRMRGTVRSIERIEVLNAGEAPLHLTVDRRLLPDYVTVRFEPETIEAGAVGDIEIGFDPTQLRTALPKRVPMVLEGLALPPSRRTLYLQFEEGND